MFNDHWESCLGPKVESTKGQLNKSLKTLLVVLVLKVLIHAKLISRDNKDEVLLLCTLIEFSEFPKLLVFAKNLCAAYVWKDSN